MTHSFARFCFRIAGLVAAVSTVAGCGAAAPVAGPPSPGIFRSGDALGYVVRDPEGRVVGRLHCQYLAQGGLQKVVARAVYGQPAFNLERLRPERTVERSTTFDADLVVRDLRLTSSDDGQRTFAYRDGEVLQAGDGATRRSHDPDPSAVPVHPDDPALLALLVEAAGLDPGDATRLSVRAKGPVDTEAWPVRMLADAPRRVWLPWGEATLDAQGRVERMRMNSGVVYERLPSPGDPPPLLEPPQPLVYRRPAQARWRDRSVQIEVDRGVLAGTLSVPAAPPTGGAPGVLIFSDLGPHNRHGFSMGVDYGTWALLDSLAMAGYAVLRLDDRGVGASLSTVERSDVDARLARADADAVLAFLTTQSEVRADSIFVMGHGFGAIDAASVADHRAVRALVLIAPVARRPLDVLAARLAVTHGGRSSLRQQELSGLLEGKGATVLRGAGASLPASVRNNLRRFAGKGPLLETLRPTPPPVAVVQGLNDFEVSWRNDAQALVRGLNGPRGRRATLLVYEDVDHLLKTENRPSTPDRYRIRTRRVDPRPIAAIIDYLAGHRAP